MLNQELEVAKSIAREAGDVMREYFKSNQDRQIKEDGTPVTIADTKINRLVIERLEAVFPDDGIVGEEESTSTFGSGRKWFCDPIDGTKAFTWSVPTAMFSLGLVVDGKPVIGVCYEPMLNQLYWATKGGGAYCNDKHIGVNSDSLTDGILGIIGGYARIRREAPYLDELIDKKIMMAPISGAVAKSVRVAEGTFNGYIEELAKPHDMAAVHLIVEEAGGRVTNLQGNLLDYSADFLGVIASNGYIHDELVALVKRSYAG